MTIAPFATSLAQEASRYGEYEAVGASYHKFVLPGEASITVMVLGPTLDTGLYEVGRSTDMGQLLALSGASPGESAAGDVRKITLRLLRSSGGERRVVYESSYEDFLMLTGSYPALEDDDVLVLNSKTKSKFGWRDGISIITASAALILTIDRLSSALK
ncbi:MAG: hypothetical protein HKN13_01095 [Rhodothermales bacterium]|nr:hypothetical protein [Rhodothermales bacterium]